MPDYGSILSGLLGAYSRYDSGQQYDRFRDASAEGQPFTTATEPPAWLLPFLQGGMGLAGNVLNDRLGGRGAPPTFGDVQSGRYQSRYGQPLGPYDPIDFGTGGSDGDGTTREGDPRQIRADNPIFGGDRGGQDPFDNRQGGENTTFRPMSAGPGGGDAGDFHVPLWEGLPIARGPGAEGGRGTVGLPPGGFGSESDGGQLGGGLNIRDPLGRPGHGPSTGTGGRGGGGSGGGGGSSDSLSPLRQRLAEMMVSRAEQPSEALGAGTDFLQGILNRDPTDRGENRFSSNPLLDRAGRQQGQTFRNAGPGGPLAQLIQQRMAGGNAAAPMQQDFIQQLFGRMNQPGPDPNAQPADRYNLMDQFTQGVPLFNTGP